MRMRIVAATTLTAVLTLAGAGTALAADPTPPGGHTTTGVATNSPGVLSGDNVQVPIHIPVAVCGDTIDVIGLLNPAAGNSCTNG